MLLQFLMAHMYYDAVPIYYSKIDIPMQYHGNNQNDSVAIIAV